MIIHCKFSADQCLYAQSFAKKKIEYYNPTRSSAIWEVICHISRPWLWPCLTNERRSWYGFWQILKSVYTILWHGSLRKGFDPRKPQKKSGDEMGCGSCAGLSYREQRVWFEATLESIIMLYVVGECCVQWICSQHLLVVVVHQQVATFCCILFCTSAAERKRENK